MSREVLTLAALAALACGQPTPPDTFLDEAPSKITTDATATFRFHASAAGARFRCVLDAHHVQACDAGSVTYGGLATGDHLFWVVASLDGADDPEPAYHRWTVRAQAALPRPGLWSDVGEANQYNDVSLYVTGDRVATARLYLGDCGGPELARGRMRFEGTSWLFTYTAHVPDDSVTRFAADLTGDDGSRSPCATFTYTEDSRPPAIQIVQPIGPVVEYGDELRFTTDDPAAQLGCALDGQPLSGCDQGRWAASGVGVGAHRLVLYARDAANNVAELELRVWGAYGLGTVAVIGNDFAAVEDGDVAQALLRNAVAGERILRWVGAASAAERAGVDRAFRPTPREFEDFSDPAELADRLVGHDALFVLDPNVAAGAALPPALVAWGATLRRFVAHGGRVVLLSGLVAGAPGDGHLLAGAWGLLATRTGAVVASGNARVAVATFPLAPPAPYFIIAPGTVAFPSIADAPRRGVEYVVADAGTIAVARRAVTVDDLEREAAWPWAPWSFQASASPRPEVVDDPLLGSRALRGGGAPFAHPRIPRTFAELELRAHLDGDGAVAIAAGDPAAANAVLLERDAAGCRLRIVADWPVAASTRATAPLAGCDGALHLAIHAAGQDIDAVAYDAAGTRLGTVGPLPLAGSAERALLVLRGGGTIDDIQLPWGDL